MATETLGREIEQIIKSHIKNPNQASRISGVLGSLEKQFNTQFNEGTFSVAVGRILSTLSVNPNYIRNLKTELHNIDLTIPPLSEQSCRELSNLLADLIKYRSETKQTQPHLLDQYFWLLAWNYLKAQIDRLSLSVTKLAVTHH